MHSPADVVAKDCLSPVASIQEVIKGAFVLEPDLAGHDLTFTKIAVAASTARAIRSAKFRVSKVRTDPFWTSVPWLHDVRTSPIRVH
jgi:hypothetical protein